MGRTEPAQALADAARRAQRAPSILNTQPWRWRLGDGVLQLFADRSRQLRVIDADGRLLTLSCGAALHHARTAVAATGNNLSVDRFPDGVDADLLATLRLQGRRASQRVDVRLLETIRSRHTDRRRFAATGPVPEQAISSMKRVVEQEDCSLRQIPSAKVALLAEASEMASTAQSQMAGFQAELDRWTRRPWSAGDGVRVETLSAPVRRPVRVRNFTSGTETLLDPGSGDDRFAEFLVVATARDTRLEWLRAGEATSAAWLAATAAGLAVSVMSDVIEIPDARALVRRLLHPSDHPQLVFRVGLNLQPPPRLESPRRAIDLTGPDDAQAETR